MLNEDSTLNTVSPPFLASQLIGQFLVAAVLCGRFRAGFPVSRASSMCGLPAGRACLVAIATAGGAGGGRDMGWRNPDAAVGGRAVDAVGKRGGVLVKLQLVASFQFLRNVFVHRHDGHFIEAALGRELGLVIEGGCHELTKTGEAVRVTNSLDGLFDGNLIKAGDALSAAESRVSLRL